MIRSLCIILYILTIVCSCSDDASNKNGSIKTTENYSEKYSGISIENEPRQGSPFIDSSGTEYFYICKKITVINDTTVPIDLKISFSKEYDHIRAKKGLKSKVFLLPEELTSDEQQYNVTMSKELKFDLGLTKELKAFLSTSIETISLNRTLNPKEKCVMRFGILTNVKYITDLKYPQPNYFGLKLKTNKYAQDSPIAKGDLIDKQLTIPLVLYLDNPYAIPCGQISFPNK
jgi:hypothetical protein